MTQEEQESLNMIRRMSSRVSNISDQDKLLKRKITMGWLAK